jgi:O-antigen/teichoic acid export membrane protein
MSLFASPILILIIIFSSNILRFFGDDFTIGSNVLIILAIGQFFNVVTGSVGNLLMMSGHEREMRNIVALCAIVNLILNFILIPYWNIIGAAISCSFTLSIQNIIAVWVAYKKMGIMTLPIQIGKISN